MSRPAQAALPKGASAETGWLDLVRQHVGSLRYGVVQVVVHDGHVIQIQKTERVRLDNRDRTVTHVCQPAASPTTLSA